MAIDSGFHAVTKADLREDLLQAEAERDRLREKLAAVVEALEQIARDCDDLARVGGIEHAEARTYKAIASIGRAALAKAREDDPMGNWDDRAE